MLCCAGSSRVILATVLGLGEEGVVGVLVQSLMTLDSSLALNMRVWTITDGLMCVVRRPKVFTLMKPIAS